MEATTLQGPTPEVSNTVEAALLALSSVDADHAQTQNGVGFNGRDTEFGNSLASQLRSGKTLTIRQKMAGYKMLRTYKTQLLRDWGIDWGAIATPRQDEGPQPVVAASLVIASTNACYKAEGWHGGMIDGIKTIPGARFDRARTQWNIPLSALTAQMLRQFIKDWPHVKVTGAELLAGVEEAAAELEAASSLTDSDIELPTLGGELMPFQKAGVAYALKTKRVLIGDEMGLGKTVQALATIEAAQAYPALVIVPAVVKLNWEREARKWLPDRSVEVLSGREMVREHFQTDIVVINYDVVSHWSEYLAEQGFKAIIMDESHYLKNPKAKRTIAVKKLAKDIELKMMLTGTAILNRPVELVPQLDILGYLRSFGGFWQFAKRYCAAVQGTFGWDLKGASNLAELNTRLRQTCYVRRLKADVLTELPAKRRSVVPMEMSEAGRKVYWDTLADLREWFRRKVAEDEEFRSSLDELDPDDEEFASESEALRRYNRAKNAEALVRINALRQTAVEAKLDSTVAWIKNFLDSNGKLVVFAHHKAVIQRLIDELEDYVPAVITGDTPPAARQQMVDQFQQVERCRVFIGNIQAAGVGITLTSTSDVVFVELPWRPGDLDQAEDRCHRIGQKDSVNAWYLLAANTIEEDLATLIDEKRVVTTGALDGAEVTSRGLLAGLYAAINEEGA